MLELNLLEFISIFILMSYYLFKKVHPDRDTCCLQLEEIKKVVEVLQTKLDMSYTTLEDEREKYGTITNAFKTKIQELEKINKDLMGYVETEFSKNNITDDDDDDDTPETKL
jgi:hypothetical protein